MVVGRAFRGAVPQTGKYAQTGQRAAKGPQQRRFPDVLLSLDPLGRRLKAGRKRVPGTHRGARRAFARRVQTRGCSETRVRAAPRERTPARGPRASSLQLGPTPERARGGAPRSVQCGANGKKPAIPAGKFSTACR